jgi:D-alanine-D-alanine ligase
MKKTCVALLFGGRSAEHDISLQSAASVAKYLDPSRFEPLLIGIDKQGRWWTDGKQQTFQKPTLFVPTDTQVILNPHTHAQEEAYNRALIPLVQENTSIVCSKIDVVFPVLHGPMGEDGTIQGLLEIAGLPYVSCNVIASAMAMDKDIAKRIAKQAGIAVSPYLALKQGVWKKNQAACLDEILQTLSLPLFVKPANLGSSVGIHKVKTREALHQAMENAFQYDTKIVIETAVRAREIEIAVLENADYGEKPLASIPGEIIPQHEFYSYTAKYLDAQGALLKIPAELTPNQIQQAQTMAITLFEALECEGMARIDLFLDQDTGQFVFNEVNTIPGFTEISMYPKLWEATGIKYTQLLSQLIDLALARHARRQKVT